MKNGSFRSTAAAAAAAADVRWRMNEGDGDRRSTTPTAEDSSCTVTVKKTTLLGTEMFPVERFL